MDDAAHGRRRAEQAPLPGLGGEVPPGAPEWTDRVLGALQARSPQAPALAEAALRACPGDPNLLLLGALAALTGDAPARAVATDAPARALALLKRFARKFETDNTVTLLSALALARQGHTARARALLEQHGLLDLREAAAWFIGGRGMVEWLIGEWQALQAAHRHLTRAARPAPRIAPAAPRATSRRRAVPVAQTPGGQTPGGQTPVGQPSAGPPPMPELPRMEVALDMQMEIADLERIELHGATLDPVWFDLRAELTRLGLVEGFDELLCLPTLQGVEPHWYQVETVRKVLKQYRGRVLLADEVGLGKTIEAGMVLKEYMLRGMAERLLILVPASLVGQWRDEMAEKFGIDCATTQDALLRREPAAFWAQPRVIASIAVARRREHAELLARHSYDAVVVDEAHHLRDQNSASYRLASALQKRFLLLLSATPVQNSLVELYNLLTLLQPGIFRTLKEFRAVHMTQGKPREPANRDRLRDLMRGVMVRNTRALAALRLPRRHAATVRSLPGAAEAACYQDLTALVRRFATSGPARLAAQHLLSAAGSSPAAAAAALARFADRHPGEAGWTALAARYGTLGAGAKQAALIDLLARNPAEKKLVFVHHRDSMLHLAALLSARGMAPLLFEGGMSGMEKDAAVARFRDQGSLLLCSESGGEGRNLQFCNTLINFDIPWNPMAIEQRIGRIDRIGQTREVFVFNLATSGTIEDAMLRILDEKINMFELVVGEVGAILGELDEQQEFSSLVLEAWLQETDAARQAAFATLERQVLAARRHYEDAKQLDDALFGDDLDAA
jgi:superfamily II DNA or RNA helicase